MLFLAMAATAAASVSRSDLGVRAACTTGPVRCAALVITRHGVTLEAASPAALPFGMSPAQYHSAYNLPTDAPEPVTVAIVDAFDSTSAYPDLTKYSKTFGLPVLPRCSATVTTTCFAKLNMGAATGSAVAKGWAVEIALDVETVHAICQNCTIKLVEAKNNQWANLSAAAAKAASLAPIVSNSYGSYEIDGSQGALDAAYDQPNHAIVVSAMDSGYGVAYPAALNTVVSVGGTTLTLKPNNSYGSETVWGPGHGEQWGTGSGCADGSVSGLAAIPAQPFQLSVANYSATGCGTNRGDNDVAADADPYTGSAIYAASTGWIQEGGTSLSAPIISAVFALKDNVAKKKYPAGFLYAKAGTAAFRDVTTGSDDAGNYPEPCAAGTTACTAAPGYDLPTGVGTPHGIGGF